MAFIAPVSPGSIQPPQEAQPGLIGLLQQAINAPGADALIGGPMGFMAKNAAPALREVRDALGLAQPRAIQREASGLVDEAGREVNLPMFRNDHYQPPPKLSTVGHRDFPEVPYGDHMQNAGIFRNMQGIAQQYGSLQGKATTDAMESLRQSMGWSPEQLAIWLRNRQK